MHKQSKYHIWILLNCILKPAVKGNRNLPMFNNCVHIVFLHVIYLFFEILLFQYSNKNADRNAGHHFIPLVP